MLLLYYYFHVFLLEVLFKVFGASQCYLHISGYSIIFPIFLSLCATFLVSLS